MWEHRDYWTAVHPYEYFEVIEDARMQHEFQTGSRGPDEVSACFHSPLHGTDRGGTQYPKVRGYGVRLADCLDFFFFARF